MQSSETIKEIAMALAKARAQFGSATRDAFNPAFRSKYADLASALNAVSLPLAAQGVSVMQFPETNVEGKTVTVETLLLHSSGEWIGCSTTMPVLKWDPQGIGSAITYARRYGVMAVCGIAPEDDDGEAAGKGEAVTEHRNPPPREDGRQATLGKWIAEITDASTRGVTALEAVGRRLSRQNDWIKENTRDAYRAALVDARAVDAAREREANEAGMHMEASP
jgi:hypothetical protein